MERRWDCNGDNLEVIMAGFKEQMNQWNREEFSNIFARKRKCNARRPKGAGPHIYTVLGEAGAKTNW